MQTVEENFRYERKFFISDLTVFETEALVKLHPAVFSEIYYRRYVNNIYFDTAGAENYFDNVDGSEIRQKFRIRWYGDLFGHIEKPVLEIKRKKGLLGSKESYELRPFDIGSDPDFTAIAAALGASDIPERIKMGLKAMTPMLLNRYGRKYFLSADGSFRITLDTDLSFYPLASRNNSFLHKWWDDLNVILELKYARDKDHEADAVTSAFPFRLTRSSKYVSGLERLYAW
jgi:SPX domain protein involved in polyphosphate accumulation